MYFEESAPINSARLVNQTGVAGPTRLHPRQKQAYFLILVGPAVLFVSQHVELLAFLGLGVANIRSFPQIQRQGRQSLHLLKVGRALRVSKHRVVLLPLLFLQVCRGGTIATVVLASGCWLHHGWLDRVVQELLGQIAQKMILLLRIVDLVSVYGQRTILLQRLITR